ncbi:MAG: hypothetical protein IPG34_10460 [Rhodocyclaceae bacterium]|nr:hypothetical protein [Rhodocyclaceae bacterium]
MAKLIDVIGAHTPAAVGLDIYMPEADGTSPGKVADNLPPEQGTLAAQLRRLPSHDEQLAAAFASRPQRVGCRRIRFSEHFHQRRNAHPSSGREGGRTRSR